MQAGFSGIYAILPTPFDSNRKIDLDSLKRLVQFELQAGVNGITILGVLGEVHRLSEDERSLVTKTVIEAVERRVPVISGTGASGTDLAIEASREAEKLGASGLMVAPPRLLKPNDDAVFKYYRDLAAEVSVPIVVQDEPATYGVHFSPALIARLAEIERVQYLKIEDPPTLPKITRIKELVGDRIQIFGALGGVFAYEELCRGACGIMTGFAYPEIFVKVYSEFKRGNRVEARRIFYEALPLIRYEAQPIINLALRKEIFRRRGVIRDALVREPAMRLDSENHRELDEILDAVGVQRS